MTSRLRSFRADDEAWNPAAARAKAEGVTMTTVIIRALERYGKGLGQPPKPATRRPNKDEEK